MTPEYLAVGRVLRPHGVRGDLLLQVLTDFPERLEPGGTVYVGEEAVPYLLTKAHVHGQHLIVHLTGCDDIDAGQGFRNQLIQIRRQAAAPLPEGQYYFHQLIGLEVVTEEGEALGRLEEVVETGANDVYVVKNDQGEVLLPAIKSVIRQIDLEAGVMTVHLLEGLR